MNAIEVSDIRRRDAMLRAWMGKRCSYKPEELPAHIVPPSNEERSACEVFEFMRDRPESYFLYVGRGNRWTVTTWMGDLLGRDVWVGAEYRSNMGDKRRSIRFTAITGDQYSGTYFCGAGDYARVCKVQTSTVRPHSFQQA